MYLTEWTFFLNVCTQKKKKKTWTNVHTPEMSPPVCFMSWYCRSLSGSKTAVQGTRVNSPPWMSVSLKLSRWILQSNGKPFWTNIASCLGPESLVWTTNDCRTASRHHSDAVNVRNFDCVLQDMWCLSSLRGLQGYISWYLYTVCVCVYCRGMWDCQCTGGALVRVQES